MKLSPAGRRDALLSFVLRDLDLYLATSIKENADGEITAVELREEGYECATLTKTDWKLSRREGKVIAKSDQKTWIFSEPFKSEIVGFYLTRPGDDEILYAEEFADGPYDIKRPGESVKVSVVLDSPAKQEK